MKTYFKNASIRDEVEKDARLGSMFPELEIKEPVVPAFKPEVGATQSGLGMSGVSGVGTIIKPVSEYITSPVLSQPTFATPTYTTPTSPTQVTYASYTSQGSPEDNFAFLQSKVIDPLKQALGFDLTISSGIRTAEHNAAIGGAKNSQHVSGEAVDLTSQDNRALFRAALAQGEFDQLIWEKGDTDVTKAEAKPRWVHISHSRNKKRGEVLVYNGKSYRKMTEEEKQAILG